MKLGLAYNLFDGEELMIDSLMNLSGQSDYVCIVYQTTSNFNQKNIGLHELVNEYVAMGLVNDSLNKVGDGAETFESRSKEILTSINSMVWGFDAT